MLGGGLHRLLVAAVNGVVPVRTSPSSLLMNGKNTAIPGLKSCSQGNVRAVEFGSSALVF